MVVGRQARQGGIDMTAAERYDLADMLTHVIGALVSVPATYDASTLDGRSWAAVEEHLRAAKEIGERIEERDQSRRG